MEQFAGTHDQAEVALKEALSEVERLTEAIGEYVRSLDETRFPVPTHQENHRWVNALRNLRVIHETATGEHIL